MNDFNDIPGKFDGADDSSQMWKDLHFSNAKNLAASNVHWIPGGPLGNSRRATSKDFERLKKMVKRNGNNFVQLLHSYAIAHNPAPEPVDMGRLPLPLGTDSPNLLVFGRSGSGKTQSVTIPAARHALENGWSMVYVNVKGVKQTRLLRRLAKQYGRCAQTMAPTKLDRTLACSLIEGCSSLSMAKVVAEGIVATAARKSRDGEGAWAYNQAEEWIQHSVAAICSDLPKSQRSLVEIRKVVQSSSYKDFADQHPSFPVLQRFARYVAEGNKNAETITATIAECTAFIDEIEEFLSKNEFSFASFAQKGGVLIVEIDQADVRRLRPFVTLFLTRLKSSLQRAANSSATGQLSNKTVFIIDELIASGPVPGLAEDLHTCRELNFGFIAGAQSISQLATIYGYEAQAVLDGFQTQIAIAGGLDEVTAEHFSRRSGVASIALPAVHEPGEPDGDLAVSRNWQLSSRPVFLPSEIACPTEHPELGMPATIIVGDGKTPAFQAYLTPCYQNGALERLMDEVALTADDGDLRKSPLKRRRRSTPTTVNPVPNVQSGISDTKGWTESQLKSKLEQVRKSLDWDNTTGSARKWWNAFEDENKTRVALVLRLAEELAIRKATVTEFFLAYVYSNTDNIQANVHYLDYKRLKEEEEARKRKAAQDKLTKESEHVTKKEPVLDLDNIFGFEVILTSLGNSKLNVLKVVKNATGKSLMDAKKLVEAAPTTIGRARTHEDAAKVVQEIQDAGGQARIA